MHQACVRHIDASGCVRHIDASCTCVYDAPRVVLVPGGGSRLDDGARCDAAPPKGRGEPAVRPFSPGCGEGGRNASMKWLMAAERETWCGATPELARARADANGDDAPPTAFIVHTHTRRVKEMGWSLASRLLRSDEKVAIRRLGFGTGRQRMALERWTTPKLLRRTCSPLGTGYNRVEGIRRASRNGCVSDLPPETRIVPIRNFSSL
jgi:hypothetical protein